MNITITLLTGLLAAALIWTAAFCWQTFQLTGRIW